MSLGRKQWRHSYGRRLMSQWCRTALASNCRIYDRSPYDLSYRNCCTWMSEASFYLSWYKVFPKRDTVFQESNIPKKSNSRSSLLCWRFLYATHGWRDTELEYSRITSSTLQKINFSYNPLHDYYTWWTSRCWKKHTLKKTRWLVWI